MSERGWKSQLVWLWLLWCAVTLWPFAQARLLPPSGRWFPGFLSYWDDFYQYLSFAEQSMRGRVLLYNKFDIRLREPMLLNLEWTAAGFLARLLGGDLALAFHALGALASGLLLSVAARVVSQCCGPERLAWRLLLFATAGGLGWLRLWLGAAMGQTPDVGMVMFPWNQRLAGGPHAPLGTALFLWALVFFVEWRHARRGRLAWLVTATALLVTRPYEIVLVILVVAAWHALELARGRALGEVAGDLLSLVWLSPAILYAVLVFRFHPSFAVWSGAQNVVGLPRLLEFAFALGPAAVLAAIGSRRRDIPFTEIGRSLFTTLWLSLAATLGVILLLYPLLPFVPQFLPSLVTVLVLLAAIGTPARYLPTACVLLVPSSLILLGMYLNPPRAVFVGREVPALIDRLRPICREGDRVLASPDIGLFVAGLTPCSVVAGHRVMTPEFAQRVSELEHFYSLATTDRERGRSATAIGARFAVLPSPGPSIDGDGWKEIERFERLTLWSRAGSPGASR